MMGLIILVAQIIILMTRVIAQICKINLEGRGRRPRFVFLTSPRVFAYLGCLSVTPSFSEEIRFASEFFGE